MANKGFSNQQNSNPEELHLIADNLGKMTPDNFVNPGTPQDALVTMDSRKTGVISQAANDKLRERMQPTSNDQWSMSDKGSPRT